MTNQVRKSWTKPKVQLIVAGSAETSATGQKNETGVPGNDKS